MKRKTLALAQPEARYTLYYRGLPMLKNDTKSNCTGEKIRLIGTGSYLRAYFDIKPVANEKAKAAAPVV